MDPKTRELLNSLKQAPAAPAAQPASEWQPGGVISGEAFAPPAPPKRAAAPKPAIETPPAEAKRSTTRAEPVTPPVVVSTPKPQMDPDLLEDLAPVLGDYYKRAQRAADVDQALEIAAELTKTDPSRVKRLAAVQGVDLEDMAKQARAGTTFEDYKRAKEGVIGFQAPEAREADFGRVARDFEQAQKGEASTERHALVPATESPAWTPLTQGYVVGYTQPEEVVETAKPGEHQYAIAEELFKTLAKDKDWAHIYDLYGRKTTGGATLQYINDRALQIMKNRGISIGSPNADEEADKARRQATNEVLAMKTIGMWTPGIFLQDVQATEGAKGPGLLAAFHPNVELVGFNNRGMAVYRQESPLGTGLRAIDTIGVVPFLKFKGLPIPIPGQAPLVGMLTRKGEETYGEAAARGIQTGANWMEYALEKAEGSSLPAKIAAGGLGLAAAIAHPDAISALGAASKSVRAGMDIYEARKVFKDAEPLLKNIVEAYKANDFEAAKVAEQALRDNPKLGKVNGVIAQYLRADAAVIEMMRAFDPSLASLDPNLMHSLIGVGLRESPDLAEALYEAAGKGRPYMHFSASAPLHSVKTEQGLKETLETFLNAGNFEQHFKDIKKARDIYLKAVPKTSDVAKTKLIDNLIAGAREAEEEAWKAGAIAKVGDGFDARLAKILEDNRAAILANPEEWLKRDGKLVEAVKADPVMGAGSAGKMRENLYRSVLPYARRRLVYLTENPMQDVVARDLKVFDRMEHAVRENIRSRVFAAEALRRELGNASKLRVTPVDLANEIQHGISAGGKPLSPYAEMYFKQIVRDLPEDAKLAEGSKRADFFTKLQNLDAVLSVVARRNKRTLAEEYRNYFRIVMEEAVDEVAETGATKIPTPPSPDEIKVPSVTEAVAAAEGARAAPAEAEKVDTAVAAAAKKAPRTATAAHPDAAELLTKLPTDLGVTEAEATRTLSAVDRLKVGDEFLKKSIVPGVTEKKFVAMRDELEKMGKLAALEDGKFVKAGEAAAPAPVVKAAPAAAPVAPPVAAPAPAAVPGKETPQQIAARLRAEVAARRAPARAEATAAAETARLEAARAKQEFEAGLAAQAKPAAKPAAAPVVEKAAEAVPAAKPTVPEARTPGIDRLEGYISTRLPDGSLAFGRPVAGKLIDAVAYPPGTELADGLARFIAEKTRTGFWPNLASKVELGRGATLEPVDLDALDRIAKSAPSAPEAAPAAKVAETEPPLFEVVGEPPRELKPETVERVSGQVAKVNEIDNKLEDLAVARREQLDDFYGVDKDAKAKATQALDDIGGAVDELQAERQTLVDEIERIAEESETAPTIRADESAELTPAEVERLFADMGVPKSGEGSIGRKLADLPEKAAPSEERLRAAAEAVRRIRAGEAGAVEVSPDVIAVSRAEDVLGQTTKAPVAEKVAEEAAPVAAAVVEPMPLPASTPAFATAAEATAAAESNRAVTESPAFQRWFGTSKVVDAEGRPLVMYHGTSGAVFSEFITRGEHGLMGQGAYFTDSPRIAGEYAEAGRGVGGKPGVYPVYLSIKNPLDMDAPADIAAWRRDLVPPYDPELQAQLAKYPQLVDYNAEAIAATKEALRPGMTNEQAYRELVAAYLDAGLGIGDAADSITETLRRMGYDGATHIGGGRVRAGSAPHRVYIAFSPDQIKSAAADVNEFRAVEAAETVTEEAAPVARKAKGFNDKNSLNAGRYEVEIGGQTRRFFRDTKEGPLGAVWMEDVPGSANMPFTFLGNTKDDAIKALQRKYVAEAATTEKAVEEAATAAPATPSGIPAAAEAPAVAEKIVEAVPVAKTPEALLNEVKSLTHSMPGEGNSVVLGTVAGGTFTPKYVLAADSVGKPSRMAEVIAAQATENITDIPAAMKAEDAAGLAPFSPRLVVKQLDKMHAEGDLFQMGYTGRGTERVAKGAFSFDPDTGEGVVKLFTGRFDPSTITHELGHYIRRTALDAGEMESITKYVKSKGINVEHKFGDFIGSADEVEKAEEAFAEAYEVYLATGRAPTTQLQGIFAKIKEVFAALYRSARNGASGQDIPEEVRRVFDQIYSEVPDAPLESTFDMIYREGMGKSLPEQTDALDLLANEAKRRGMTGVTTAELNKKVVEFVKNNRGAASNEKVALEFPAPVMGKAQWTGSDLRELQQTIDFRRTERGLAPLKAAMFGDPQEVTATEQIYRAVEGIHEDNALKTAGKSLLTAVVKSQIGGDIVGEMGLRSLPPAMRKNIMVGARLIQEGLGDSIGVVNESILLRDRTIVERFLAGEAGLTYRTGRRVVTSGQQLTAGFLRLFSNAFAGLSEDEQAVLQQFAAAANKRGVVPSKALIELPYPDFSDILIAAEKEAKKAKTEVDAALIMKTARDKIDKMRESYQQALLGEGGAFHKFMNLVNSTEGQVGPQLAKALHSMYKPGTASFNEYRFAETLLYLCGATPRNGALMALETQDDMFEATRILLDEAQSYFGTAKTAEGEEFARRLAVIVGTYGTVSTAKSQYQTLGVILTAQEANSLKRWTDAYDIKPEMRAEMDALQKKFGLNTAFVPDTILGTDVYIPAAARQIIADSLAKAQFSNTKLTKAGDLYQAAFSFTKKRMTRGNFVLRQRYYTVNTVDHFHQLTLVVGAKTSAASTSRLAFQTIMTSPFTGQLFETAARGLAMATGNKDWLLKVEKLRDGLQNAGDTVAHALGTMFGTAKYRLEVNKVLEGSDELLVIGGRATSYGDIKRAFIGEGVFSNMNTRYLGQTIRREGSMFLDAGDALSASPQASGPLKTAWAKLRDGMANLTTEVVDDIGDAWGERERIGAAITIMEAGYDARTAARLVIDGLYDYAQSMTKADRSALVGLVFPFWTFQKNANQQFINTLFTSKGAYRMMVLKKFRDRATDLVAEIYYDEVGGELGIDVKSMPTEMQDYYYSVMEQAHDIYGPSLPPDVAVALRMIMTGRSSEVVDGKYVELDEALMRRMQNGAFFPGAAMQAYVMPLKGKNGLPTYIRDRPGVMVVQRRNATVRHFNALRGSSDDYFYLMLPESSVESAMKHTASSAATILQMIAWTSRIVPGAKNVVDIEAAGDQGTNVLTAVQPIIDLERSPVAGPLINLYVQDRGYPKQLHPWLASYMQRVMNMEILQVPADMDPFSGETPVTVGDVSANGEPADFLAAMGDDYVKRVQEMNKSDIDLEDLETVRARKYYLAPGAYSIAFENSPALGELNQFLLSIKQRPQEQQDAIGKAMYALRAFTGYDVAEVSPTKTAIREEPVTYQKTKKPF